MFSYFAINYGLPIAITFLSGLVMLVAAAAGIILNGAAILWHKTHFMGINAEEPACPKCRYIIKGVAANLCPECGQDLSEGLIVYATPPPFRIERLILLCYGAFYMIAAPLLFELYAAKIPLLIWHNVRVEFSTLTVATKISSSPGKYVLRSQGAEPGGGLLVLYYYDKAKFYYAPHSLLLLPRTNRSRLEEDCNGQTGRHVYEEFYQQARSGDPWEWHYAASSKPYNEALLVDFVRLYMSDEPEDVRAKCVADLSKLIAAARAGEDIVHVELPYLNKTTHFDETRTFYSTPRNLILYTLTMLGLFALWPITILLLRTAAARKQRRRLTVTT